MLAMDAGTLLMRLARGGDVDLAGAGDETLRALVEAGLIAVAPDTSEEARLLTALRAELQGLTSPGQPQRGSATREKELRAQILDLVDKVSRSQGAAVVRGGSSGPYRAGSTTGSYVVTYAGRALMSDLAARLGRVGRMSLTDFRAHMTALREVFDRRGQRLQNLLPMLRESAPSGASEAAVRSAALGLAARNEPERDVASAWISLTRALAAADLGDDNRRAEWTPDQEAAAAEGMILGTRDLRTLGPSSAAEVHRQRSEFLRTYSGGNLEDALDATMLLAGGRERLSAATQLATAASGYGVKLTLTSALVLSASRSPQAAALVGRLRAELASASEGQHDHERTSAAVLLALSPGDALAVVGRARDLRSYLARFAPTGMLVPAALLSLLPTEVPETLDLLRMASMEIQKRRLGAGGAEALTLSIKLLLSTALLARGDDGDPEERAGFIRFDDLAVAQLGIAGLVSQVPLSLSALTAFHRPVLDAAIYHQETHQPTHSPYVFGSSRGGSWG